MFQKFKRSNKQSTYPGVLPGQIKATQHPNAANFPEVGMTMSAYRHDAIKALSAGYRKRSLWYRIKSKITPKRAAIVFAILLALIVGWLGWKFIYNGSKIFGGNIFGIFDNTRLKGENVGRVNILLAGNSADDVGHSGGTLTDSIMLVSLDTRNNRAYLLSIPRDLWVNVPGYGYHKINEAYVYGQANKFHESGYASGGMGLLEKTVSEHLQLPINYYALINYSAFRDAVNAVGGIDITVKSEDSRGLYDPSIDWSTHGPLVNLTNGKHHLSGREALDLARARGDAYGSYGFPQSDFDRTAHQREMLVALKSKVLSTSVLANPVKLSNLFDAFGRNIRTDFKTNEVHRLYTLSKKINNSAIKSLSLNDANGKNLLTSYATPVGSSALIPAAGVDDYSQIVLYLKRVFSNDPVVKEAATAVVLNGTNTFGLASKESKRLESKGIDVVAIADASSPTSVSKIIDNSMGKKLATKQYLRSIYGDHFTGTNPYANLYTADFIVIVGSDKVL